MSTDATETQLLTKEQAAGYLNVTTGAIYHLKRTRQIAFHKIGGKLRFAMDDLNEFLEKSRTPAADYD